MTGAVVRTLRPEDWAAVRQIYADGIEAGNATFETEPPDWEAFDTDHSPTLRFVADLYGTVAGWAAARPVSDRCVYAGVAEHSIYVATDSRSHGIGRLLVEALIARSEDEGIWTMQSGVFPENTASLHLHAACGFEIIGTRRRVGRHQRTLARCHLDRAPQYHRRCLTTLDKIVASAQRPVWWCGSALVKIELDPADARGRPTGIDRSGGGSRTGP